MGKDKPIKMVSNGRDTRGRFMPGHKYGKGRPRNELSITNLQREMLPLPCPYSTKGQTWLQWLADRGLVLAGENPTYYRELMDRLEGKIMQPIDSTSDTVVRFTIGKGYDEQAE